MDPFFFCFVFLTAQSLRKLGKVIFGSDSSHYIKVKGPNIGNIGNVGKVGKIGNISNICNVANVGDIGNIGNIVYSRNVPEGCFKKIFGKFFQRFFFLKSFSRQFF